MGPAALYDRFATPAPRSLVPTATETLLALPMRNVETTGGRGQSWDGPWRSWLPLLGDAGECEFDVTVREWF